MDSTELNEKLSEISDESGKYGFECFGGKALPYIGWFWRTVNFDATDGYYFGLCPNPKGTMNVGFMENNKWDYSYVYANADEWKKIKDALRVVAENPNSETLKTANDLIQALKDKKKIRLGSD